MQSLFAASDLADKYLAGDALVCSDNIDVLRELTSESVDLIYLDPPFQSASNYVAIFGDKGQIDQQLRDIWVWTAETERTFQRLPHGPLLDTLKGIRLQAGDKSPMAAYSVYMGRRLMEMHRVLKPTGSIYLHCDWHADAYLRILMDSIFETKNFRRQIIWHLRAAAGFKSLANNWIRGHDTILYYAKSHRQSRFNKIYLKYDKNQLKRFSGRDGDGRRYKSITAGRRLYLDEAKGVPATDVWSDIASFQTVVNAKEHLHYPTQKPLALLERIIKASSNEGDLVMDPFCGCGTAVDAAAKLGRKYLGVDISAIAVRVMEQRLRSRGEAVKPAVYGLDWSEYDWEEFEKRALQSRDDAEDGTPGWAWAEDKVAGLLNAVPNSKKTGDGGVDARYYGAAEEVIPIQVKMHQKPIGRPDLDKLLGAQTAMRNRGVNAPMSLMVSLYPPASNLRTFAAEQGRVELHGVDYPVMQALSVEEMLTKGERPKLPPVDPRSLVGNTQTRMIMGE